MQLIRPENSINLRRPVTISAIAHVALILMVLYVPGLGASFFGERPVRITMWVELPKGTSDDIGLGMKKAKSLPQSTIEEQKRLFQPEEIKQQAMKPTMTAPPEEDSKVKGKEETKRPKLDAVATRKNDKEPPPKPAPKSRTDRKIHDALAKIDKQLKGRTIVPESAQVSEDQNGYKYGTGTEPLRVEPSDPEYLKYQAMVRSKIISAWIVPLKFMEESGPGLNAQIEVLINMDGEVVSVRWEQQSGNPSFDQSAVRAIKNASPFPKPPDRLAWEAYNEGFLVEFDPRLKTR